MAENTADAQPMVQSAVRQVRDLARNIAALDNGSPFREAIATGRVSARELGAEFGAALAEALE